MQCFDISLNYKTFQLVLFPYLSKYQAWKGCMILQRQLAADWLLFVKREGDKRGGGG